MERGYFITGTDTNVGKTWVTVILMEYFKVKGKTVVGLKPVASGCRLQYGKWLNNDALLLQQHASIAVEYDHINPYAYEKPVSPHIAGVENPVELARLMDHFLMVKDRADVILVEGAGGWYSPINQNHNNADIAKIFRLPVILVVGIRLGCINHALLSYRAIIGSGCECAAWVAVCSDPDVLEGEKILSALRSKIDAPLIGVIPFRPTPDFAELSSQITIFDQNQ